LDTEEKNTPFIYCNVITGTFWFVLMLSFGGWGVVLPVLNDAQWQ